MALGLYPLPWKQGGGFGSSETSHLTVLAERCADNSLLDRAAQKHQFSKASKTKFSKGCRCPCRTKHGIVKSADQRA